MIYKKYKERMHKKTYEQFEREFIQKHKGDILSMFNWVIATKSDFNPNGGLYEHFLQDFICWCDLSERLFYA
tara:strand:- start:1031 stop:1246 length:216 start_codon:yes stop_codon:yes gene_type:complete